MGMSTKKPALVATTLAMTLAASLVAVLPAEAAAKPTIPNNVALKKKDVRALGPNYVFDLGVTTTGMVTFAGQYCDTTDNGATGAEPLPTLGRWWTWYDRANDLDVSVDHVVTSWADSQSALADIQNDTGHCRVGAMQYANYAVQVADDDEFVATWDNTAVAAQRIGNNIVAITVNDWNDRIDERAQAERLLDIAAAKVAKSRRMP